MPVGSGTVVITSGGGESKPKGIIDALSEIEKFSAMDRRGSEIPERFFTTKNRIEYFEAGFKGSLVSGLVSALLAPLAIGVLEKLIPVFGDVEPTAFDKGFVFLIALSFSIGYAVFIGGMGRYYTGKFTRVMIRSFVSGTIIGAVLKMVLAFILFHFLYLVVLTEERIAAFLSIFRSWITQRTLEQVHGWIVEFRPVLLISAWFIVLTTVIFIMVPVISIGIALYRERKTSLKEE
jgi:uncharacterized membrane protein (UPF0136 family)